MPLPPDPGIQQMIKGIMQLPEKQPEELKEGPAAQPAGPVQPPEPKKPRRGLSNPFIAAEAQRVFNPQMPPVPAQQPSNKALAQGTASTMDTNGRWGQPEREENGR